MRQNSQRLDAFTRAFLTAALVSSNDDSNDQGGDPLDDNYSIEDFDENSLKGLVADCERFQKENAEDLSVGDDDQGGHDFWFTRCGHGVGFWDGDWPEPQATRLTEASKKFGNVDLYVGDDGLIYAMGYESGARKGFREHTPNARAPRPKFKAGDRVERDDGSSRGEVAIVGNYDEFLGCYRYKVQQDGGGRIWWNESSTRPERTTQARNGRREGILSDGTRVAVYHKPGTLDEYTTVPHGVAWDSLARGDMRSMLGTSATGLGFSQWTEGQEGRHLGRKLAWQEVPDELKRHIERRVVGEATNMASNGRRKKTVTVDDLPESPGNKVLACPGCGSEFGAGKSDYFWMPKGEPFICDQCGDNLTLATRSPRPGPPPQEARHTPGNRAWDEAEDAGLVRMVVEDEQENYFSVYGEPDTAEERQEIIDSIERDGCNMFASQFRKSKRDAWETADSIGMVIGSLADSGHEDELKQAALDALKGHRRNGPSAPDEHAARELSLYIENDYSLIGAPNSQGKSIDANLRKKVAAGTYDTRLAPKAWLHLIDKGAQKYTKEFGSGTVIFNLATRMQVAKDFARAWEEENLPKGPVPGIGSGGLTQNAKATIRYVYAGQVERPSARGYVWHDGYSENENTYPWLTMREAQADAKARGARAVFERP